MAEILIRNISPQTKERLRQRAKRQGKSLGAYLCDALERIADEDERGGQSKVGFGTWLASISRPAADLSKVLDQLRSAPLRQVDFE